MAEDNPGHNRRQSGLIAALLELCFPPSCLLCRTGLPAFGETQLCPNCRTKIRLIAPPLCRCCGTEFLGAGENHLCGPCLASPPYFERARSVFRYDDQSGRLLHAFKYGGKTAGRRTFAALARESGALSELAEPELILPVPLHPRRLRARGFNQALVLALFLMPERRERIRPDLLRRHRWTEPQTSLSGQARRQNLSGAFSLGDPTRVRGRRVLLVDDVFTTGTTINECAKALRQAGAAQVEALTLARVGTGLQTTG